MASKTVLKSTWSGQLTEVGTMLEANIRLSFETQTWRLGEPVLLLPSLANTARRPQLEGCVPVNTKSNGRAFLDSVYEQVE